MLEALGICSGPFNRAAGDYAMDDYQEELLERDVLSQDMPDVDDDATEL